MHLPVVPPVAPMLAKAVTEIPANMHYEAKWDGFRAIIFRDGDDVVLGSRNERPLTRYFPEIVETIRAQLPDRCVIDGEIIIVRDGHLDFDALLARIHPAASRVNLLAQQTPASFVAFDLLALDDENLMEEPFGDRRAHLEQLMAAVREPLHLAPATRDRATAQRWFVEFEGAGLDGIVAKDLEGRYQPNKRVMVKIKHGRTVDVVVAGFRWHKSGPVVGSLLLGLYDEAGALVQVGVSSSFTAARRIELVALLEPFRLSPTDLPDHPWIVGGNESAEVRRPGTTSRWNAGKDLSWVALRPELVAEVAYDQMQGTRFRHTAQFRRWRPDRQPQSCTFDQLDRPITMDLSEVLG